MGIFQPIKTEKGSFQPISEEKGPTLANMKFAMIVINQLDKVTHQSEDRSKQILKKIPALLMRGISKGLWQEI